MKILMESTEMIVKLGGVECRIWNAVTEDGTQCYVFVRRIAVREPHDKEAFSILFDRPEEEVLLIRKPCEHLWVSDGDSATNCALCGIFYGAEEIKNKEA